MKSMEWVSVKCAVITWIVFWVPISLLFPSDGHVPLGALFSPLTAWFMPFGPHAEKLFSFDLKHIYLPALTFWLVTLFIWLSCRKRNDDLSGPLDHRSEIH